MLREMQGLPQRVHDAAGSGGRLVGAGESSGGAVGGVFSAKISVFFKSMGLMKSDKKGKLIHTVAGVV